MTPDPNMTRTTPLDPDRIWPNRHQGPAHERIGELQQTCRVLTELAQQLTNAAHHVATAHHVPLGGREHLQAALDAAAELGITPQDQP